MDPTTAYYRWAEAVAEGDRHEANEHYIALRAWLERGGFEPSWTPEDRADFFSYNTRTGQTRR